MCRQASSACWNQKLVLVPTIGSHRRLTLTATVTDREFCFDKSGSAGSSRTSQLPGLVRGSDPIGWLADVMYVPSSENRSHGSALGGRLRRFCNGTRFRYAFG